MLSKFSVKKSMTAFVVAVLIILLGVISYMRIPTDLLPNLNLPYIMIITSYPGASPEKVEKTVTKPLEESMATTGGIKNVYSTSNENSSMITLEFDYSTNMDSAMIEISNKADIVKGNFDEGVGSPTLLKLSPDMMPINVSSIDMKDKSPEEISDYVSKNIISEFEKVEGVASVEGMGLIEENVTIQLNDKKIEKVNNALLNKIDGDLGKARQQINGGKSAINSAESKLNKENEKQLKKLAGSMSQILDGKDQVNDGIKEIDKALGELKPQEANFKKIVAAYEKYGAASGITEKQYKDAKKALSTIKELEAKRKDLIKQRSKLNSALSDLDKGKQKYDQEISKAHSQITTQKGKLEDAEKDFEAKSEEALKSANLNGLLSQDTVVTILQAENFSMPAGYVKGGSREYLVKVGDEFKNINEIKDLVLVDTKVKGIGKIRLKDVASVKISDNSDDLYAKLNGNDGVLFTVQKQSTASTSEVSKGINKKIDEINAQGKVRITTFSDSGNLISMMTSSVMENLILGGVLAIFILFIFMKDLRPTLAMAISIPISVLLALALMYFTGVTINIISLAGLALGVGMLVDNSIVVLDNIFRLRAEGYSAANAAVKGANEVVGAIIASTLTTVCVFLPIVFTDGISRQIFTDMGLTIAYSLLASLLIAITMIPAISSKMLHNYKEKENKTFNKIVDRYVSLLSKTLRRKSIVIIGVLLMFVLSIISASFMGTEFMPTGDSSEVSISVKMPVDSTKKDTRKAADKLVKVLFEDENIETFGVLEGSMTGNMGFGAGSSNSNSLTAYVLLKEDKTKSIDDFETDLTNKIKKLGTDEIEINRGSNVSMSSGSAVQIDIYGDDLDKLRKISDDIAGVVKDTKGTTKISNGITQSAEEVRITIDKNKAMGYGLTVAQVYSEISGELTDEKTSTTVTVKNKEYPVIVVKDPKSSMKKSNLWNYKIDSESSNKKVPLYKIANIQNGEGLSSISHENGTRYMSVTADIENAYNIGIINREIQTKLSDYNLPDGYSYKISGENETINESLRDLLLMILVAIIFIYLIMVAQFQSLLSPFIIMFTLPLAFTGGLLALFIFGFELSVIGMLGFLVLSGVVVNNGIVFVDYVNQLRMSGIEKRDAILITGQRRIRPILMTALTTILGLLPLAIGFGGEGSDMIQPLAVCVIGGLLYATVLTLFFIPVMYDIFNKSKDMERIVIDVTDSEEENIKLPDNYKENLKQLTGENTYSEKSGKKNIFSKWRKDKKVDSSLDETDKEDNF